MAKNLDVWKFAKRVNSLKVPGTADATFSVCLKESCSLDNPVFVLSTNGFDYNYMAYDNKFYWVTEKRYIRNNLMEISGAIDVLATYRSEILATRQHVARSSSSGKKDIVDTMYSTLLSKTSFHTSASIKAMSKGGIYVVIVAGTGGGSNVSGFTKAYGMSASRLRDLAENMYSLDDDALNILSKVFLSPFNAITSVFWCPFDISSFGGGDDAIVLGNVMLDTNGNAIVNRSHREQVTLNISGSYGDWRDLTCRDVQLYLPCVGTVPISANDIYGMSTITVDVSQDILSGGIAYRVYAETGDNRVLIGSYGANTAVSIPIGQNNNIGNGGTSFWSWIGKNASTIASGFTALTNRGFNTMWGENSGKTSVPSENATVFVGGTPSASGSFSSIASIEFGIDVELFTSRMDISEAPNNANDIFGRPCGMTAVLNTLTGYCQTINACVGVAGELGHNNAINAFLNGGVYIE